MNLEIVIPIRLNSSRVYQKVEQTICVKGKELTLIDIKIRQLLRFFSKGQIILSYSEDHFDKYVKQYGIKKSKRDNTFSESGYEDVVTTRKFMQHIVKDCSAEYIGWCTVVTPFHNGEVIKEACDFYLKQAIPLGYDSLVTISNIKHFFWYEGKPLNYFADERHVSSQDVNPLQKVTNGLYLNKLKNYMDLGYFLGEKIYPYVVDEINSIDIDTQTDLDMARALNYLIEI